MLMPKPYYYWNYEGHKVLFWIDNFGNLFLSIKTIDTIIGEESLPGDIDDKHLGHIFAMYALTKTIDNYTLHLYPEVIACLSLQRAIRRGNERAKTFLGFLLSTLFKIRGENFNVRDPNFTPTNETIVDVIAREGFPGEYKNKKTNRR